MNKAHTPLQVEQLLKTFSAGETKVQVLKSVSLTAEEGDFIAIMGPSGSGKSTLLHCIAGLTPCDGGRILLDGENISACDDQQKTALRRQKIGFVFQAFNLLPNLNVQDNICLPLYADGKKPDQKCLRSIVERLGIADKLQRRPASLSGGEQQRVAIARALMISPSVILADEPTGSLDSMASQELCQQLQQFSEQDGKTILMVTHEPAVALWAKRVLVLLDGKITGEIPITPALKALELAGKYSRMVC
ncbi:MAG: ABC transporter ATP-binding protein [Lentisphaeria bacterium]